MFVSKQQGRIASLKQQTEFLQLDSNGYTVRVYNVCMCVYACVLVCVRVCVWLYVFVCVSSPGREHPSLWRGALHETSGPSRTVPEGIWGRSLPPSQTPWLRQTPLRSPSRPTGMKFHTISSLVSLGLFWGDDFDVKTHFRATVTFDGMPCPRGTIMGFSSWINTENILMVVGWREIGKDVKTSPWTWTRFCRPINSRYLI